MARKCLSFQQIGGDCRYLKPFCRRLRLKILNLPFILIDRDAYMDLAKVWDVYGIPSLVVLEKDKEIGRFVNRDRKTKAQITAFLAGLKIGENHDCNIQQRTSRRCLDADLEK